MIDYSVGAVEFLLSTEINELSRPGFEPGLLQPQRNFLILACGKIVDHAYLTSIK